MCEKMLNKITENEFLLPDKKEREEIKRKLENDFDKIVKEVFAECKKRIVNAVKLGRNFLRIEDECFGNLLLVNSFFKDKILREIIRKINSNPSYEAEYNNFYKYWERPSSRLGINIYIFDKTAEEYVDEILKIHHYKEKKFNVSLHELYSISHLEISSMPREMTKKIISLLKELGYESYKLKDDNHLSSLDLVSKV